MWRLGNGDVAGVVGEEGQVFVMGIVVGAVGQRVGEDCGRWVWLEWGRVEGMLGVLEGCVLLG